MDDTATAQDQGGGDRYSQLQGQLISARENAALLKHHQAQVQQLQGTKETELARNEELAATLASEQRDVEKLEGMSLKRLRAMVGEGKDEALVRERLEAQIAADTFESSQQELAFLGGEIERYEALISGLGDTEAAIETARVELEAYATESVPHVAAQLVDLDERVAELRGELVEIGEAVTSGENAARQIAQLREDLRQAENMSNFDTWGGGSWLISMKKRDLISASSEQTRSVAHALESFDRELGDTGVAGVSAQLDLALTGGAFDVWFDNIFTDFSVHGKIKEAQAQTETVAQKVDTTLDVLKDGGEAIQTLLKQLDDQRLEVLSRS